MVPFILTQDSTITMVLNNKPYTIQSDHLNYNKIVDELKNPNQDINVIIGLLDIKQTLNQYANHYPEFVIDFQNSTITINDEQIHGTLIDRIFDMHKQGFPFESMGRFLINLYQNPSKRAVDELYSFIEYGKLPITEDGCFLAYKRVKEDYTSCYDNKTKNDIGTIVSMPRDQVDDNSNNTCSSGLHLCSYEYLKVFDGDRVVIVKVNPKNVVSIPTDYNNTKARACEYEIVGEVSKEELLTNKTIFDKPVVVSLEDEYDEDFDDSDDDSDEEFGESNEDYEYTKSWIEPYVADLIREYVGSIDAVKEQPKQSNQQVDFDSKFFKAAYNNGYYEGKNVLAFDDVKIEAGDIIMTANNQPIQLDEQQAYELNCGYELGYKHGRGHRSRLFKDRNFTNTDIVI